MTNIQPGLKPPGHLHLLFCFEKYFMETASAEDRSEPPSNSFGNALQIIKPGCQLRKTARKFLLVEIDRHGLREVIRFETRTRTHKSNMSLVSARYKPSNRLGTADREKRMHSLTQRLGPGSPLIRCGWQMCCTGTSLCVGHNMCVLFTAIKVYINVYLFAYSYPHLGEDKRI